MSLSHVSPHVTAMYLLVKVSTPLSFVRSLDSLLCRYKADLATRDNRLHELQNRWFNQQMVTGVARPGAALPMTQEQRDMASAVNWFKGLGWDDAAEDGALHTIGQPAKPS